MQIDVFLEAHWNDFRLYEEFLDALEFGSGINTTSEDTVDYIQGDLAYADQNINADDIYS